MDREAHSRLGRAFDRACAHFTTAGFEAISEVEQTLVVMWGLEGEVNNGGFEQYFINGAGEHAALAEGALRRVGADKMADLAAAAVKVFGPAGPAREWARRRQQLEALGDRADAWLDPIDRAFYDYPDDVGSLTLRYVEANAPDLLR